MSLSKLKKPEQPPLDGARLAALVRDQRWLCLGTLSGADGEPRPLVSWVAYAAAEDFTCFVMHLSNLAQHTGNLKRRPQVSLAMSEADDGRGNPQLLARLTLEGRVAPVARDDERYESLKGLYLAKLPDAEPLFEFGDFNLYAFVPGKGRYVDGFGQAYSLDGERLRQAASA